MTTIVATTERGAKRMRLINADKLREDVLDLPNCYNGYSDTYDKACIIDLIDEQPTVEPQLIRCKECKLWHDVRDYRCPFHRSGDPFIDDDGEPEDFCSYAERRTDEAD